MGKNNTSSDGSYRYGGMKLEVPKEQYDCLLYTSKQQVMKQSNRKESVINGKNVLRTVALASSCLLYTSRCLVSSLN